MPSRRQERVAKRIVQELVGALRNLKHADFGFVTVTRCEISPDLHQAKVFVSIWGDEAEHAKNMELLNRNRLRIKSMIARPLGLKVMPDLHFLMDETIATSDRISRLIRDARQTDSNPNPLTPEEEAAFQAQFARAGKPAGGRPDGAADAGETGDADPFEAVRQEIADDLLEDENDPAWQAIDLDALPEEDDEDDEGEDDKKK